MQSPRVLNQTKKSAGLDGILRTNAIQPTQQHAKQCVRTCQSPKRVMRHGRMRVFHAWRLKLIRECRYSADLLQNFIRHSHRIGRTLSLDGVHSREQQTNGGQALMLFFRRPLALSVLGRLSLLSAFFLGMGSMTLLSQNLGESARSQEGSVAMSENTSGEELRTEAVVSEGRMVSREYELTPDDYTLIAEILNDSEEQDRFEERIRTMVAGHPIEAMIPAILKQDRIVAAFLVSIAKKESNWGKRVPVLGSQDCFNYWGYRGIRARMGTGGHTCFNGISDAVETVGQRLQTLIEQERLNTPAKMVIWKCGYSCDGHSRESVRKWIADVNQYYQALNIEQSHS